MPLLVGFALFAGLAAAACGSGTGGHRAAERANTRGAVFTVASFAFSESHTLAEVYAEGLERRGFPVGRAFDLASREVVEPALEQGVVDMVPEYLGTALTFVEGALGLPPTQQETYARLQRALAPRNLMPLAAAPGENKNGIAVTRATAQRLHVATVSDLAPLAPQLVFGGPPECPERPLCLAGLSTIYGITFKQFRALDAGGPRTVAALEAGDVDAALLFTTDPHLGSDFVLLSDDRSLQPSENVVPVVRRAAVDRFGPGLVKAVDTLSTRLGTEDLVKLNRRVVIDGVPPTVAAADWLRDKGLG
jgi:osmoprotectant transport system substrate-binding protein